MKICLSIDVDWAPDFVIEWMRERIKSYNIPATWFATHDSQVLRQIADDPSQEIGLHPNFFGDSTQGINMEEVMTYLTSFFPMAIGVRAHAFLDSTRHQWFYKEIGIKYISNLIIWNQPSNPYFIPWADLWQIPISWEDDRACFFSGDNAIRPPAFSGENSVWVLTFHPLYCYLNDKVGMIGNRKCKALLSSIGIKQNELTIESLFPLRQGGKGLTEIFDSILNMSTNHAFLTLSSFYRVF